jgi:hypothetical protein
MNETSGSVLGLDDLFSVMPIEEIFQRLDPGGRRHYRAFTERRFPSLIPRPKAAMSGKGTQLSVRM